MVESQHEFPARGGIAISAAPVIESSEARMVAGQLAEDLGWLEEHCRVQPQLAPQAGQLRFAAALVRNLIGPYLDDQAPTPLHIAVVGGAGAGKSTVVNLLSGSAVAEANPQAGYTRHPTAYVTGAAAAGWNSHLGFLGPLQRLKESAPANLDQDVYQVRRVDPSSNGEVSAASPLVDCVIWDCPDMTTWAATGYLPRLIEVAGLADVIVYVASDERYNDEVPTQFLHLLIKAGKPVIVCLTKMRESDAASIVTHFQAEVLNRLPRGPDGKPARPVPVLAIPFLAHEQLADPAKGAGKYRIALLNQVTVLTDPPEEARQRTVQHGLHFLTSSGEGLLEVARHDLAALEAWRNLVQTGQVEFDNRYRREFLSGERFRRFDEVQEQLMQQLELPGLGRGVSTALWVVRLPYRLVRSAMGKALARPESVNLPEHEVLEAALRAWLDQLRAEAIRRAPTHPLWKHIAAGFDGGLGEMATERFENEVRRFQLGSADELDATIRSVAAGLQQSPSRLGALRAGKVALDLAAVFLGLWAGGIGLMSLIWVPLFASIAHQGVEMLVRLYVDQKRQRVRASNQLMVSQYISAPLAEWLIQWPTSGGSAYERLQIVLRRIPVALRQIADLVERRAAKDPPRLPAAV
jgi:50S ribosome-binding GTPase